MGKPAFACSGKIFSKNLEIDSLTGGREIGWAKLEAEEDCGKEDSETRAAAQGAGLESCDFSLTVPVGTGGPTLPCFLIYKVGALSSVRQCLAWGGAQWWSPGSPSNFAPGDSLKKEERGLGLHGPSPSLVLSTPSSF
jgi:hypothetical protein